MSKDTKLPAATYPADIQIQGNFIAVRTLQDHGRIQIPKKIRDALTLREGDSIYWIETEGKYCIVKATSAAINLRL